jgi:hypothetical protein
MLLCLQHTDVLHGVGRDEVVVITALSPNCHILHSGPGGCHCLLEDFMNPNRGLNPSSSPRWPFTDAKDTGYLHLTQLCMHV